jgi:hypothetical protein
MGAARGIGLAAALGLTLAATWYAAGLDETEPDQALNAAPRPERASRAPLATAGSPPNAPATSPPDIAGQREPIPERAQRNLFAARSWQPPPPPPPMAAPAAPAQAPPLPFRYLGRMEDGDDVTVFLLVGNEPRVVRQGDQLPNYRIDEINARGMRLTYLPLDQTQRMLFGSND